jgi:hypothetical protein
MEPDGPVLQLSLVLTIVGLDALIAYFAKRAADLSLLCPWLSPSMASQRS